MAGALDPKTRDAVPDAGVSVDTQATGDADYAAIKYHLREATVRILRSLPADRQTENDFRLTVLAEVLPMIDKTFAAHQAPGFGRRPERTLAQHVQTARLRHARAYEPWTAHEEAEVTRRYLAGQSPQAIAVAVERKPGAVITRLRRLGLPVDDVLLYGLLDAAESDA